MDNSPSKRSTPFFAVSTAKFIVMSVWAVTPGHDPNSRFSFWNVLLIVTVVAFIALALFALRHGPAGTKQFASAAWI